MNSRNLMPRHSFHDFPMFPLSFIGHAEQIPLDTQRFFQGCGTLASTWKIRATMNFDVKTPSNQRSLANEILPKMLLHFLFFGILESSSKIWDRVKVHAPHVLPFRREESGGFCSEAEPCGRGGILPSSMRQKGSQCLLKT